MRRKKRVAAMDTPKISTNMHTASAEDRPSAFGSGF
jgi:hypothetical protein